LSDLKEKVHLYRGKALFNISSADIDSSQNSTVRTGLIKKSNENQ